MHGKGDGKKRKRWEERCALDQGQRESPLERLQSKSLIYKYASPSFLTPLSPFYSTFPSLQNKDSSVYIQPISLFEPAVECMD